MSRSAKTEQIPKNENKNFIINPESTSFYVQNELRIRSSIKKLWTLVYRQLKTLVFRKTLFSVSLMLHSPRHELHKTRLRVASKWAIGVVVLEAHARYERNRSKRYNFGNSKKKVWSYCRSNKKKSPPKFFFVIFMPCFFYFLGTCSVFAEPVTYDKYLVFCVCYLFFF